jgi:crotonobetainyl-CoA:carnitine CoA-transferase CaiB-like acyl-CoA transferase
MLSHFAADVARASTGAAPSTAPDWPWSAYRAQGEDEWCVVSVRGNQDWRRLSSVVAIQDDGDLASPEARLAARERIDLAIGEWVGTRSADDAMRELQAVGVPAARMLRLRDLPEFDYFAERGFYRVETHPYLQEDVIAERRSGACADRSDPPQRPAPLAGEHTAEVVAEWLDAGIDTDGLIARGVLEPLDEQIFAAAQAGAREAAGASVSGVAKASEKSAPSAGASR